LKEIYQNVAYFYFQSLNAMIRPLCTQISAVFLFCFKTL